jgi:hypothetical protein
VSLALRKLNTIGQLVGALLKLRPALGIQLHQELIIQAVDACLYGLSISVENGEGGDDLVAKIARKRRGAQRRDVQLPLLGRQNIPPRTEGWHIVVERLHVRKDRLQGVVDAPKCLAREVGRSGLGNHHPLRTKQVF